MNENFPWGCRGFEWSDPAPPECERRQWRSLNRNSFGEVTATEPERKRQRYEGKYESVVEPSSCEPYSLWAHRGARAGVDTQPAQQGNTDLTLFSPTFRVLRII